MNRTGLLRLGGLVAMVGGVAFASGALLGPLPQRYAWIRITLGEEETLEGGSLFFLLLLVGAMAAIVAIAALHILGGYGVLHKGALVACAVVAFVGVALILVGELGLSMNSLFYGLLIASLGILALGIAVISARVLPWWCGVALIAGSPLGMFVMMMVSVMLSALGGVAWALVGYAILRAAARRHGQPSRVR
jgi:hypothetical protein